jgi:hypothetical protein
MFLETNRFIYFSIKRVACAADNFQKDQFPRKAKNKRRKNRWVEDQFLIAKLTEPNSDDNLS